MDALEASSSQEGSASADHSSESDGSDSSLEGSASADHSSDSDGSDSDGSDSDDHESVCLRRAIDLLTTASSDTLERCVEELPETLQCKLFKAVMQLRPVGDALASRRLAAEAKHEAEVRP